MSTFQYIVRCNRASVDDAPGQTHNWTGQFPHFSFAFRNLHPFPSFYEQDGKAVVVLGSPIVYNRIDPARLGNEILTLGLTLPLLSRINGSFLIFLYNRDRDCLQVANDRFASIPFFYALNDDFFSGGAPYLALLQDMRGRQKIHLNIESFFEFIYLQRLLGNRTYDRSSSFLNAASLLSFQLTEADVEVEKYWQPKFWKPNVPRLADAAVELAEGIQKALSRRTSDNRRYGFFLSGGLDSRAVLAAAVEPLTCFTVGEFENNEFRVARQLAGVRGFPHVFIQRAKDHYARIVDDAIFVGSAMNVFDHAHFLGLGTKVTREADAVFHGHGFDYFFQGMYLPTERVVLMGRSTYLLRLKEIDRTLCETYVNQVKYRLKSIDPLCIVRKSDRDDMRSALASSVKAILKQAEGVSQDMYDQWEFLHLHNLSRHYTNLNLASMRTFVEERTVAFDNDIFDIYLKTPIKYRLAAKILRAAIHHLDRRIGSIPNANTNLPARWGPVKTTVAARGYRLLRKLGMRRVIPEAPASFDRSWPDRDQMIRAEGILRQRALSLKTSARLDALGFIDMDALGTYIDAHMQGAQNYGALILSLLTIDGFLLQMDS